MIYEKRRIREKEIRKGVILKAARKLFLKRGFKSVTVDNIAKKAEISKGAIYLYFRSKDDIYIQILLNDIDTFNRKVSALFENGKRASEMLFQLSAIYVDFFLKDKELFRILMTFMLHTDHSNLPDDHKKQIIKTMNKSIDVIEKIFQHGIDEGEFPPTINLRQNRNALWGLLNGIISLHIFTGLESRREELIRTTINTSMNVFIKGLRSG